MTKSSGKLALLGTSADPPTRGHQALLEGLLRVFPKVATWASNNPQKKHEIPLQKRQELLSVVVKFIGNKNLELAQELSSPWTVKTIEKASQKWPNRELTFIIGSDLLSQVPEWLDAKTFLTKSRIGIVPRIGWPIKESHLQRIKDLGGQIDLLSLKIPPSASSETRENPSIENLPPPILQLLLEQNLYHINKKINSQ